MNSKNSRSFGRRISTLLLAFVLAIIVWVSAVTSADPNEKRNFQVPIDVIGLSSNLEIISNIPNYLSLTLVAPHSILEQLTKESTVLQAWVDLSELESGTHSIHIQYQIPSRFSPVRIENVEPATIDMILESLISKTLPIQTDVRGKPPLGYQVGNPEWSHDQVSISGRASLVEQVSTVRAVLSISGIEESIERNLKLTPYDQDGYTVSDITLTPGDVTVFQPITLKGGYRNMVVKVVTTGQVGEGYRQTSISVSPPNVMLFSADSNLIDQLPGYVETTPLDLTNAVDDFEASLSLDLPDGVSVVGDPNVLVQVGIAAMEGNITVSRVVEAIGTLPEYQALVAPASVEVILYGPIPILEALIETDIRVVVNLAELEKGTHQLTPEVIVLPKQVQIESVSPSTLEVEITDVGETANTPTAQP
ncbi:MAG: CdaR family protein [Chloroflexota bacterium]|nr:CdaR family protein [Chloroflexota bacterium]